MSVRTEEEKNFINSISDTPNCFGNMNIKVDDSGWLVADSLSQTKRTRLPLKESSVPKAQDERKTKIERLETEVARLNSEIKNLQSHTSYLNNHNMPLFDPKIQKEFEDLDNYRRKGLISDLKNKLIDIGNRFKYFSDIIGPAASERQNLIKAAFKTIFDSVLPNPMKLMMLCVEKGTNATSKDYDRLIKMSKFSAFAELKNPKYGEIDHAFFEAGVSTYSRDRLLSLSAKIIEIRTSIKTIIQDLVKLRNKLLSTQKGFNIAKMLITANINPLTLSQILQYCEKVEGSKKITTHEIWGIKKKSYVFFNTNSNDNELTEEE